MLPNLTNQYISYSMAIFSANEIRTFYYRRLLKKAIVIPFNDKSLILTFIISDDYHKFHNRDTSCSLMKNKEY